MAGLATPVTAPASIGYSTAAFRREREAEWAEFEAMLGRLERGSLRSFSDDDLLALPRLYRAILSSLSIARSTSLDRALVDYLEGLSMRGYFLLYGVRESRRDRFARFFAESWPNAVRSLWKETIIIGVLLFLGVAVSWALVAGDPAWFHIFIPPEMAQGRDPDASAAALRETIFGTHDEGGFQVFATYLFTHNSQVSILSYALGFAFGLPTMMLETYQGLTLGALTAVFAKAGMLVDFLGWISIHGTTELFAAILSGAAGLRIGTAFAFPGHRSRLTAAAEAGKATGAAMIGVILMLLVAGLLEGFGRQMIQSTALRYTVGAVMLTIWCAYFYIPRRGTAAART
jgi:uncharacterized membrane protein SpoIIM required for sporulation